MPPALSGSQHYRSIKVSTYPVHSWGLHKEERKTGEIPLSSQDNIRENSSYKHPSSRGRNNGKKLSCLHEPCCGKKSNYQNDLCLIGVPTAESNRSGYTPNAFSNS